VLWATPAVFIEYLVLISLYGQVSGLGDLMISLQISALPGSYAILLALASPRLIQPGALPATDFPAGYYVYTGSAGGPGCIRARLMRHVLGAGKKHWHVDWLRQASIPVACWFKTGDAPLECKWIQRLMQLEGFFFPLAGFGASDCRYRCPAHLIGFYQLPDIASLSVLFECDEPPVLCK